MKEAMSDSQIKAKMLETVERNPGCAAAFAIKSFRGQRADGTLKKLFQELVSDGLIHVDSDLHRYYCYAIGRENCPRRPQ